MLELDQRHGVGFVAQALERLAELPRQELARLHGNQLAHLHRRATHFGQTVGQATRVAGNKQQVLHGRPLALTDLAHPFAEGTASDAASQSAQLHQSAQAGLGDATFHRRGNAGFRNHG